MREVRCTSCNTLNRVRDYSFTRIPWCGKRGCGAVLPEPAGTKPIRFLYQSRRWAVSVLLGTALLTYVWVGSHSASSTQTSSSASSEPVPTCVAQDRPYQGEYAILHFSPRRAPFKINTAAGFDYLVKLENVQDRSSSLSFFVYGGVPFETDVPLGVYVLKYAAGKTWCGDKDLFGKETFAKKGSTLLVFEQKYDRYSGQAITLIAQPSGNFRTDYIKLSEF